MPGKTSNVATKVEKYYQHYGIRARELKAAGERFIGYICSFVPLEIIAAAGFIPFRILPPISLF